jgi:hypothetical protein
MVMDQLRGVREQAGVDALRAGHAPAAVDVERVLAVLGRYLSTMQRIAETPGGALQRLAASCAPLRPADLAAWHSCLEHGSFHGLMTAFCAFVLSPEPACERLLVSCLLHDFARTFGPVEGHDARLADYFPGLLPETYDHSAPKRLSTLVRADRLELQRYPDHREWLIDSMLAPCADEDQWPLIHAFYGIVRPALARLVTHRDPTRLDAALLGPAALQFLCLHTTLARWTR